MLLEYSVHKAMTLIGLQSVLQYAVQAQVDSHALVA